MKSKVLLLFLLPVFLISLTIKMFWLAYFTLIICGLFFIYYSKLKPFIWLRKKAIISVPVTIIGIFILAISARIFLIEIYSIPSSSMEDALLSGDKVLVSKLSYGPRIPRSPFEIPWVNLFFYMNKEARASADSAWYGYKRLSGFSEKKREDIIVFNFPHKKKEMFFIKRCIGLPGETIEVKDGEVLCNGQNVELPANAKMKFKIWVNNLEVFVSLTDSLGIQNYGSFYNREKHHHEIILTNQQYKKVKDATCIDSIKYLIAEPDTVPHTYPHNKRFLWTFDNFGPVVVPKKGMEVELTPDNYYLYRSLFKNYEGQQFKIQDGQVLSNGDPIKTYTFKQDYFFMLGDNRQSSYDSRGWGFVPEEGIVGKAVVVLFSNDYSSFRWGRVMKVIK